MFQNRGLKKKFNNCNEIALFVKWENVEILFTRPWPIVMFEKRGLKKKLKLINCNEIPLFVMWENVAIFLGPGQL